MQKELNLFSDLFADFPNLAILHINNEASFINDTIKNIVDNSEGKLNFYDLAKDEIKRVKPNPREYEYVVLSNILEKLEEPLTFYRLMYRALENSGNIIILEKSSSAKKLALIKDLLDKSQFVAINDIKLFDDYLLVTAKKMHMWGNGL